MKKAIILLLSFLTIVATIQCVAAANLNAGNIPIVYSTVKDGFNVILQGQGTIESETGTITDAEWALTETQEGNQVLFVWNQNQQTLSFIDSLLFLLIFTALFFVILFWLLLRDD